MIKAYEKASGKKVSSDGIMIIAIANYVISLRKDRSVQNFIYQLFAEDNIRVRRIIGNERCEQ